MKYYIGIHKDSQVYKNSSSGGAFTAISDYLFEKYNDLVIYGCILDEKLDAVHIRGIDKNARDKMRGSKYILSKLNDTYNNVFIDLSENRKVLFSGTPCQVYGLKKFLDSKNCNYDGLITIDFICHGVGEVTFFKDYINHLEKKYKSEAITCRFRGKTKPGKFQDMVVEFKNGKKYIASSTNLDWFYSAYHRNLIQNPSCYSCNFSNTKYSDITLADDWSLNRDKVKAHSLLISNSEKGDIIISSMHNFDIREVQRDELTQLNENKISKPHDYEEFWNIYKSKGYLEAQRYIGNNTFRKKIKVKVYDIIDFLNIRQIIKKYL